MQGAPEVVRRGGLGAEDGELGRGDRVIEDVQLGCGGDRDALMFPDDAVGAGFVQCAVRTEP